MCIRAGFSVVWNRSRSNVRISLREVLNIALFLVKSKRAKMLRQNTCRRFIPVLRIRIHTEMSFRKCPGQNVPGF